jgi:K+-transporting ATPase ATPase B chain
MAAKTHSIFEPTIVVPAIADSFKKLNPIHMVKNPVMFVTEVGAAVTTVLMFSGTQGAPLGFLLQITLWLWFTVLFANFAEAMAEGRGKAQADSLRKARTQTFANRVKGDSTEKVSAEALHKGDLVIVKAAELIPGDGEIVEGAATVDESAITGESAPVVREAGGDRSAVTGGTRVLSDVIKIRITSNPGETFLDRMIGLVEGAKRQKTPNEIALTILLSALTLIFLVVLMALKAYGVYQNVDFSTTVLVALLVCLIPTTIGGLLSAIGIAGIDRLVQKNVLAMSGRAVEAAGDVDVLLLDKTGTIGPTSQKLVDTVKQRVIDYRNENALPDDALVPGDAVTASGSGLDPHISAKNAELQASRVAKERNLSLNTVKVEIGKATDGRSFGVLGEPGVNVLKLNIALDNAAVH